MILASLIIASVTGTTLVVLLIAFLMLNGLAVYEFMNKLSISKVINMFLPNL